MASDDLCLPGFTHQNSSLTLCSKVPTTKYGTNHGMPFLKSGDKRLWLPLGFSPPSSLCLITRSEKAVCWVWAALGRGSHDQNLLATSSQWGTEIHQPLHAWAWKQTHYPQSSCDMTAVPANCLAALSWKTLSQNHPVKLHLGSKISCHISW